MDRLFCGVLCLLVLFCALLSVADSREVVCYYGNWAVYRNGVAKLPVDNIDPKLCTQLNYAFFGITGNGNVRIIDEYAALPPGPPVYGLDAINKFYGLKQINPALKTIAAIGGYNTDIGNFSQVAASPQLRSTFASNAVAFLQKYRFDGMDIDWEFPSLEDKNNYVLFLQALSAAFAPYKLLLTVAVPAAESATAVYDIPGISKAVNFINLMEYDMQENFGVTRHHAALYPGPATLDDTAFKRQLNVESSVKYWLSKGAPAGKLNLGIPFYGHTFKLANPSQTGVGAPTSGLGNKGPYSDQLGFLAYNEICPRTWTAKVYDQVQGTMYAYDKTEWVSYDSAQSITGKCNLIAQYGLAGGMVWSLESDDFSGTCGKKWELLTALNQCVNGAAIMTTTTTTATTTKTTTKATAAATTKATTMAATTAKTTAGTTARTTAKTTTQPAVTKSSTSGSGRFVCPSDGYFKDPANCAKYYQCANGTAYSMSCPSGLYFNEIYKVCDWPANVKC
ncbi:probable chitinase 10 [Anopheles nili]|uniref:probable chitinase 10 n=1 Tax=Anopheles nili TaxID=185578 RepID=UPI00237C2F72|nr:probable chitinase 10 [Anopheles nili]